MRIGFRITAIALLILCVGTVALRLSMGQGGSRLQQAFERVDTNGDKKLSQQEINRFPQLKTRLTGADQNGDEFITMSEFQEKMSGGPRQQLKPSTGKLTAGESLRVVQVGKLERRYLVYVPKNYDDSKPTPVVIAFHGGGGNPESMVQLTRLNEKSEKAGFVVVYPYGSGTDPNRGLSFNGGGCCGYAHNRNIDDIGFVSTLLDDLELAVNVDQQRVYATGISNGGIMTYYVASELSERIAAIAPIAGPMMTDTCHPQRPVPVMHFHGTGDQLAPFDGGKGAGTSKVPAFLRPSFNSVEHSLENWIKANGCKQTPTIKRLPDRAEDGMSVTRKTWSDGRNGSEVILYEIKNGGHTWPGQKPTSEILGASTMDISANDLMWEFFLRHPIPSREPR